jgi:hypothetical protein
LEFQRILKIPLIQKLEDDFIACHKSKNHIFSECPGYYSEWEHQFGRRIRRQDDQGTSRQYPVWDVLCKLNVPGKVKIFIWRYLHGFVPMKGVLANRHMKGFSPMPDMQTR